MAQRSGSPGTQVWTRVGWILVAAGVLGAVGSYIGTVQAKSILDDLSYIATGGVVGAFSVGLGAAMLAAARLAESSQRLVEAADEWRDDEDEGPQSSDPRSSGVELNVTDGGERRIAAPTRQTI